jgi:hypothetical protein
MLQGAKIVIFRAEKPVSAYKARFPGTLISIHEDLQFYGQCVQIKIRMTRALRFWVDVECERIKNHRPGCPRTQLIAQILGKFEEVGEAMRYVNSQGEIAWKATTGMLSRLADAEQEAIDDMDDCL